MEEAQSEDELELNDGDDDFDANLEVEGVQVSKDKTDDIGYESGTSVL